MRSARRSSKYQLFLFIFKLLFLLYDIPTSIHSIYANLISYSNGLDMHKIVIFLFHSCFDDYRSSLLWCFVIFIFGTIDVFSHICWNCLGITVCVYI